MNRFISNYKQGLLVLIFLISLSPASQAAYLFDFGMHFGGDVIDSFTLSNQNGDKRYGEVKAGSGFKLSLGLLIPYDSDQRLSASILLGYKTHSASAINGKMGFSSYPIEVLQNINLHNKLRLGLGAIYYLQPMFVCEITAGCDYSLRMRENLGFVMQLDLISPLKEDSPNKQRASMGVRFYKANFKLQSGIFDGVAQPINQDITLNGDNFSIFIGIQF
ncbi:MAG: hypothetical protein OEY38_12550 [Gammaproteobacteria bacterium]|nr:hypothetical protein [Gammaproteobacteria bacterium]